MLVISVPSTGRPCPLAASSALSHPSVLPCPVHSSGKNIHVPFQRQGRREALDPRGPAPDASPTFTAGATGRHSRDRPGCQDVFPKLLEPCRLSLGVLRDWGSDRSLNPWRCTGTSLAHLPAAFCSPAFPARL